MISRTITIIAALFVLLLLVNGQNNGGFLQHRRTASRPPPVSGGAVNYVSNDFINTLGSYVYPDSSSAIYVYMTNTVGTGNGRLLVATFSLSDNQSGSSVTQVLSSVVGTTTTNAFTRAGYVRPNGGATSGQISLWYLANPDSGDHIVAVRTDINPADALIGHCFSFTNVNGASVVGATNQGSGTANVTISSTLQEGDMSVAVIGTGTGVSSTFAQRRWSTNYSTFSGCGAVSCSTTNSTAAASRQHEWDIDGNESWGVVILSMPHN